MSETTDPFSMIIPDTYKIFRFPTILIDEGNENLGVTRSYRKSTQVIDLGDISGFKEWEVKFDSEVVQGTVLRYKNGEYQFITVPLADIEKLVMKRNPVIEVIDYDEFLSY